MIPSNQFGMTNTPEGSINAADGAIGEGSGGGGGGSSPIDLNIGSDGISVGVNL